MANYAKREQTRAEIAAFLEAGMKPKPEPPRCAGAVPATIGVYLSRRDHTDYYCQKHLPENAI